MPKLPHMWGNFRVVLEVLCELPICKDLTLSTNHHAPLSTPETKRSISGYTLVCLIRHNVAFFLLSFLFGTWRASEVHTNIEKKASTYKETERLQLTICSFRLASVHRLPETMWQLLSLMHPITCHYMQALVSYCHVIANVRSENRIFMENPVLP